jgi:hypothetical protein
MAISTNTNFNLHQSVPSVQTEIFASQRLAVVYSSPMNEITLDPEETSSVLDSLLSPGNSNVNDWLIDTLGINEVVQNGINIDQITGIGFDQNLLLQDYWSAAAGMNQWAKEISDGIIGGFHWSEFAQSGTAGNLYKAGGVVVEAYECTSKEMTNAWNNKEEQLKQTGEDYDLNGDGYSGDAPTGDGCDGEVSLFDSAWEALIDWLNEDSDDKDSDEDSKSDPNDCFDMPWLNEQYISLGAVGEPYAQDVMDYSSQLQMSGFGNEPQASSFQNMPMI